MKHVLENAGGMNKQRVKACSNFCMGDYECEMLDRSALIY